MTDLSINLNKIALIRNSRVTTTPDVVEYAKLCIDCGGDGITVHPRPDQRHIRAQDCRDLKRALDVELNIEGNPFAGPAASSRDDVEDYPGFLPLVEELCPAQVTLVPDNDTQLTSDHGFDVAKDGERLAPIIDRLKALGCRVSIFMDPLPDAMPRVAALGADRIELYTESYARAHAADEYEHVLSAFQQTALAARAEGLGVNAGHDLNLRNLPDFKIRDLAEVSIGHAFTADALRWGIPATIERYQAALGKH